MPHTGIVVLCPFYVTHYRFRRGGPWTITCENIAQDMGFDVRNMLKFPTPDEQVEWMEMYCADPDYQDCPYYRAIYSKYKPPSQWQRQRQPRPKKEPPTDYEQLKLF